MDFELKTLRLPEAAAYSSPALAVLVADGFEPGEDALSALIQRALASGDFKTEAGALLSSFGAPRVTSERLLLVGIGNGSATQVRKAVAAAVGHCKRGPANALTICFAAAASPDAVAAAVGASCDALYQYTTTKGHTKASPAPKVSLKNVALGVPDASAVRQAFDKALGVAHGVEFAREWANRPANYATPTLLAQAAQQLAKPARRISCDVLGPKEVAKLGMGAFQAVAQGSAQELRFIVLRYQGAAKADAPVVLVGKGITFDTGGISIKPAGDMDEMKFDMGGAASVLGVFRALGELQPAVNVVGLIPACENMPDGAAVKPGDVVTSMSGQTIEILNTDAEGRLVLCDALTYAERFQPKAVIDIATLTGACVIALGGVRSGLFSTDDSLALALQSAGQDALDLCWRLPLDDDYAEGLKTNFADVANVAGRQAGAVTAAKFLQRFTSAYPWAHLDIAGTAWKSGAAKGATGRPVGLLVQYLLSQAGDAPSVATVKAKEKTKTKSGKAKRKAGQADGASGKR
ncbi:leucyl aminopeptidase [Ottowia oryzae]|uniref:Probable cytosol aminopeptidase n=1 Tax=Ottowia oryzae TaxID=2109914 RepID=A0A2S0MFS3_9BURK|nr:leucyl aminopeptidase [Ottowia oryzae]AVO34745.1 leucyl aminopeptidase [Ottowia oryzae]